MFEELSMWIYGSIALFVFALLWLFATRELICDGCGQVCSELKEGCCEYCEKQLAK